MCICKAGLLHVNCIGFSRTDFIRDLQGKNWKKKQFCFFFFLLKTHRKILSRYIYFNINLYENINIYSKMQISEFSLQRSEIINLTRFTEVKSLLIFDTIACD